MRRCAEWVRAIVFGGALVFGALLGAPDARASAPDGRGDAERVLDEVEEAGDAALSWLRRQLEGTAAERWARAEIREAVREARAEQERTLGTFAYVPGAGDALGGDWRRLDGKASLPGEVVLLVHGLDEPGDIWSDLAPALLADGRAVVRFNYPNDQAASASGDLLIDALRALKGAHGVERAHMVCHSMGGLIARDALTRPGAREGMPAFGRMILVGTPNAGSAWASVQVFGEIRDHVTRWIERDGEDPGALLGFLLDGTGEAADDLLPGSAYLADLNARPLPEDVEITIIAGRASPVEARAMRGWLNAPLVRRVLGPEQAEDLLAEASEAIDVLGDGLVSLESARLAGVDDFVVVEGNHRSILRRVPALEAVGVEKRDEPPAIAIVLDRLPEPAPKAPEDTDGPDPPG